MSDDKSPLDAIHERATNRRLLIRAVAEGRYTPKQAEAIAATEAYGPLLPNPTYDEIDGFAEPAWSLLMAFAWVAWGQSPTHVRNYFAPYRHRLQVWQRHGVGHRPEAANMHNAHAAVELSRKDSHDDFASAFGKEGEARASLAWDRLTAKFRSGEIATEGQLVNDLAAGIVPIPAKNWRTLLLMPPTGALTDALCYADGNPVYFNVTADKEQLLKAFPARDCERQKVVDIARPEEVEAQTPPRSPDALPLSASIEPDAVAPDERRATIRACIDGIWLRWGALPPEVLKHEDMARAAWEAARNRHPELPNTPPSRDSFDRAKKAIREWLAREE